MSPLKTLFLLFMTSVATAQVGINTNLPDPSAILEVYSETQGLLTPRMTTAQKHAITSPATGLIVFDTSLNSFQFFDGLGWVYLSKSQRRDNYKLIKKITDLSDELIAGGGSKYVLNTDFLYEINGTIIADFPIDLNGAYVEGVDSSEDILINNSSGSLFEGAKGGGLRNLTLSGSIPSGTKKQLFDITANPGELLLVNNTILANSSKIGTLDGLSTVFLSVTQYVGNDDGFTISDIGSFFVSNIFWTSSNTGTFLELLGTFTNLQMNGGRIEAEGTEIGIDVSSNPTIVNDATLSQLSLVGDGTFVDGYTTGSYTGYNFTNNWNVNCSGIPLEADQVATGNFFYNGSLTSGFSQSIGNTAAEIQGNGTFTATDLFRFSAIAGNNELVYEGKKIRNVKVNVSLSVRVTGAAGDFYAFAIAKNGVIATETNSIVNIFNDSQIQNVALNGVVTLEPTDRITVIVNRLTNGNTNPDTLIVFSENLSIN